MPILVYNPKDHAVVLESFDGDSVSIPPKVRGVQVANKFNWKVPTFIKVVPAGDEAVDPTTIVPSPPLPEPVTKPPKSGDAKVDLKDGA